MTGSNQPMKILVLDIGGSEIKALATGQKEPVRIPSGRDMTPRKMVAALRKATARWKYDAVSIGYPGEVVRGCPAAEAPNLSKGWVGFDFEKAFGRPVRIVNDAAMQALGSYQGGRMLFLGLGTGLGSALILDGVLHSMEFGDLPYRNDHSYADYLGKAAIKRLGQAKWASHVRTAVGQLKAAVQADYTVLGGGQAMLVKDLPTDVVPGDNSKAFLGGFRLWQNATSHTFQLQQSARRGVKHRSPHRHQPGHWVGANAELSDLRPDYYFEVSVANGDRARTRRARRGVLPGFDQRPFSFCFRKWTGPKRANDSLA